MSNLNEFVNYCWSFYAPGEMYGEFFGNALTLKELKAACQLRALSPSFEGDTVDREAVRDLLFMQRGQFTEREQMNNLAFENALEGLVNEFCKATPERLNDAQSLALHKATHMINFARTSNK